ncbi:MAG TPA: ATP-binding cassette domain-containing protein [Fibrobacteraceae bacterium]|nr:ATP-binding cassette domain-containing protein [Fibrobacteraceae bacterium]
MNQTIQIRGARLHNLKDVSVEIPLGQITALCGPSGCGKSTLAIDVLHAECQRRYLETLSPFVARIAGVRGPAPVDSISGLRPSIALESSTSHADPHATVGSATECEPLLRTLWVRKAVFTCPKCGRTLDVLTSQEMVERIANQIEGSRLQLLAPVPAQGRTWDEVAQEWISQGFVRGFGNGTFLELALLPAALTNSTAPADFSVVVDRWILRPGLRARIADSVTIALRVGQGALWLHRGENTPPLFLSLAPRCPEHGLLLPHLDAAMFSAYSVAGRCPQCEGRGESEKGEVCSKCNGDRLHPLLLETRVGNLSWRDVLHLSAEALPKQVSELGTDLPDAYRPTWEQLQDRLGAMERLGLGHLALGRGVKTLSDGEWQRLRLVALASGHLNGLLFVLDEPGAGLHAHDCARVWEMLCEIRARDNTLLLIEHQPYFLERVDSLVEMGPGAGELGGEVLRQGPRDEVLKDPDSPTAQWLTELRHPTISQKSFQATHSLRFSIEPFRHMKAMDIQIPTEAFTVVCGVSGSGKSTLVFGGLAQAFTGEHPWCNITDAGGITKVLGMGRSAAHASQRSFVATLGNLMTPLRDLFASLPEARARGFKAKHFSLNAAGGRCEACQGLGRLEDPAGYGDFPCPVCQGRRFREDVLGVRFKTLNMAEVLDLTVDQALEIFHAHTRLRSRLEPMRETGLGYLRLGQSTRHMSGGELQRLSLAVDLTISTNEPSLYLFDEAARGLHRNDITHLLNLFRKLIAQGHTIIAIEHQPTLVQNADWILELGPGAAENGGQLLRCGPVTR